MRALLTLFAASVVGLLVAAAVPAAPAPKLASAVVYVDMGHLKTIKMGADGKPQIEVRSAHGSGVAIGNGYVLTAAHVADDKQMHDLTIIDSLGHKHSVEVLWANHTYDVALLRMGNPNTVATDHLSGRFLDKGEELSFEGDPYELHDITTWGRVSKSQIEKLGPWAGVNTVNANIDPGMSGGPAFDASGNVVGINVGTVSDSGLSFIVPGCIISELLAADRR